METKDIKLGMVVRAIPERLDGHNAAKLIITNTMEETARCGHIMEVKLIEEEEGNVFIGCAHDTFTLPFENIYWFLPEWLEPVEEEAKEEEKEVVKEKSKKETQLYYVACKNGFICYREDCFYQWYTDNNVRYAYAFSSWLEADTKAKEIHWLKDSYYAILGTCQ